MGGPHSFRSGSPVPRTVCRPVPGSRTYGSPAASSWEVAERLLDFVHELEERHPKENVAAVSHGGSLRLLIAALLGIPLERSYCLRMDNLGSHTSGSYPRRANALAGALHQQYSPSPGITPLVRS